MPAFERGRVERANRRSARPNLNENVTYFVGRETVVSRTDGNGLPRPVKIIFPFLLLVIVFQLWYIRRSD